ISPSALVFTSAWVINSRASRACVRCKRCSRAGRSSGSQWTPGKFAGASGRACAPSKSCRLWIAQRNPFASCMKILAATPASLWANAPPVVTRPLLLLGSTHGLKGSGHMRSKLTTIIMIGMVLGILVGWACNTLWPDPKTAKTIAEYISLFTDIFLRLIKMIIAPLVFSTLVVGVAHMGDTKAVGRIGAKAMVWFIGASLVSLMVGMILVNILRPGDNLNLPLPDAEASTNLKVASLSMKEFVAHLVPRSIVEAMATNEILQIVVFSLFFGVACAALGERTRKLVEGIEQLSYVILSITGYVMALAPIAVFASMAAIVTTQGLGILVTYGKFVIEFYFGLAVLWCLLIAVGFLILGHHSFRLVNLIREPFLLAFSTASSEAAYPKT